VWSHVGGSLHQLPLVTPVEEGADRTFELALRRHEHTISPIAATSGAWRLRAAQCTEVLSKAGRSRADLRFSVEKHSFVDTTA
jgi:hypothetical protein